MAAFILLGLFVGLPIAEILTFIEVGGRIGGFSTIAATIATAIIGAVLFRVQGMITLARARESIENGRMPLEEVIGGLGLLLAAGCLFVPGLVTDTVGFLLFIPPIRVVALGLMLRPLLRKAQVQMSSNGFRPGAGPPRNPGSGETIDGDFADVSERDIDHPTLPRHENEQPEPKDRS
ncbi:MAG: FxsA family protein [Alphaproteobacteria bacterium]|nr:FxsA family protein [Alphaproteobacteria bacterium]